jgi:hypothetical protein
MMLGAIDTSTILALVGILVLWFSLKRFGRRSAHPSSQRPVSRPTATSSSADFHRLDAPESVARWEVTMHETARDLMGRLDSKIVIVEQLVREAHQAAARLEALVQRIEQNNGQAGRPDSAASDPIAASGHSATGPSATDPADSTTRPNH